MQAIVTGGAGFIGSHLVNRLVADGHEVTVIDNLSSGVQSRVNSKALHLLKDITSDRFIFPDEWVDTKIDVIFHLAAVSRTPPAIKKPAECTKVNVLGTVQVLELARLLKVPRVVVSSSNVVYAADTPYKASKLAAEEFCKSYNNLYGVSVIPLRYSNVYGSFIKKGDPAVFASLRDCQIEKGYIEITGDGTQSRDFTHVSDIVEGNLIAAKISYIDPIDLCTGVNTSMNEVAKFFNCPVRYIPEREGDIKHIRQDRYPAFYSLGWEAKVKLEDGIKDIWTY